MNQTQDIEEDNESNAELAAAVPDDGSLSIPLYRNSPSFKIQNIVSTVDLGVPLDLCQIAVRTRNSEYRPKRFSGLVMRITLPPSTGLLFSTGKMVISGCKSVEDSNLAGRKIARIMQKLGYEVKFKKFQIINIVALTNVRFPINLDHLYENHCQFCTYEPEIFPALFYHMLKPKVTFLLFVSGKIIMTGAKEPDELKEALDNIYPLLLNFRKSHFR